LSLSEGAKGAFDVVREVLVGDVEKAEAHASDPSGGEGFGVVVLRR